VLPTNFNRESFRRWGVRLFVVAMLSVIVIETMPRSVNGHSIRGSVTLKHQLAPFTKFTGLWQGEWPLFAPNPVLNNAWISAEISAPSGERSEWNSTFWASASTWEKFRQFRYINFYNRLPFRGAGVADDFADFIARQQIGQNVRAITSDESLNSTGEPTWSLQLNRNQMDISLPDDGTLPPREETTWIISSSHLSTREYRP
jgi:hypothetical protein